MGGACGQRVKRSVAVRHHVNVGREPAGVGRRYFRCEALDVPDKLSYNHGLNHNTFPT
jgi:hypothetical protein